MVSPVVFGQVLGFQNWSPFLSFSLQKKRENWTPLSFLFSLRICPFCLSRRTLHLFFHLLITGPPSSLGLVGSSHFQTNGMGFRFSSYESYMLCIGYGGIAEVTILTRVTLPANESSLHFHPLSMSLIFSRMNT